MSIEEQHIITVVKKAICDVYQTENNLISYYAYNRKDNSRKWSLNEEAVMFRFGYHLQKQIEKVSAYQELVVDCNCAFDGEHCFKVPGYNKTERVKPDVIIHKRNTEDSNLLVIEMKMHDASSSSLSRDRKKLIGLTNRENIQHFEIGLLIKWGIDLSSTRIEIYTDGEQVAKGYCDC